MGAGDNAPPSLDVLRQVQEYQEQFPEISFRLSRLNEFAAFLSSSSQDSIPTFQGDNPSSWADGTLSLARETALHRASQWTIITAETLDAPLVALGERSLLNFTNMQPQLSGGMHFNLLNNLYGTNFRMWYDEDARFRFLLRVQGQEETRMIP
jgi:hypothetical protein